MTYATVEDVANELGRASAPAAGTGERAQWEGWLNRVEMMIKTTIPALAEHVASGAIDQRAVASVEAAAVARKVQNPEGTRATTVAVDDGTVTKTRDSVLSDGVLRILPEEWDLLMPRELPNAFSSPLAYEPGWRAHGWRW